MADISEIDDRFEFDAPKHVIDFSKVEELEVDEGYFFSKMSEDDLEEQFTPTSKPLLHPAQPSPQVQPTVGSGLDAPSPSQPAQPHQPDQAMDQQPVHTPEKPLVGKGEKAAVGSSKKTASRARSLMKGSPAQGVRSSPRLAALAKALRRKSASRQSLEQGKKKISTNFEANRVNRVRSVNPVVSKISGMKKLTAGEQQDLQNIASFKQKISENKKKVGKGEAVKAVRAGPTRPVEFHFATDSRIKGGKASHEEQGQPVNFTRTLRSSSSSSEPGKEGGLRSTVPQPFKFTELRKDRPDETQANKFVSVAELNMQFYTKTPQRFRSKRAGSVEAEPTSRKSKTNPGGITIPHTPQLTARTRYRSNTYLTREEQEQKEFEEAQKHAFKAHPINKKVLASPPANYKVEKKLSTVPEPFNITDAKRAPSKSKLDTMLQEMCESLGGSTASLASVPHGGVPCRWENTATKVQPFSFDSRDKHMLEHKERKIKKIVEEEKKLAQFQAQPMPVFETGVKGLPHKKPQTPTRLMPFDLKSDQRGQMKQEHFHKKLEEEDQQAQLMRTFHAQSKEVIHKAPFIPEKSKKPLTDISGFTLNTEVRAQDRTEFELHKKLKEDEIMAAKKEQERLKEEQEAAEIARLRKEVVHKAKPVRKLRPMVIEASKQPLTLPISPNFSTDSRLRSRRQANSSNISQASQGDLSLMN